MVCIHRNDACFENLNSNVLPMIIPPYPPFMFIFAKSPVHSTLRLPSAGSCWGFLLNTLTDRNEHTRNDFHRDHNLWSILATGRSARVCLSSVHTKLSLGRLTIHLPVESVGYIGPLVGFLNHIKKLLHWIIFFIKNCFCILKRRKSRASSARPSMFDPVRNYSNGTGSSRRASADLPVVSMTAMTRLASSGLTISSSPRSKWAAILS